MGRDARAHVSLWSCRTGVVFFFLAVSIAHAEQFSDGQLIEDFTTIDHADFTNSTGVWNIVDHVAQAAVVENSNVISFGNGSDGVLNSSSGFNFDTNAHPSGYNFVSVNITGGTITVTGSNPLIIRSLSTINIAPNISVRGTDGSAGTTNGSTTGPTGGVAVTCAGGVGGHGGNATGASGSNGGDGIDYQGNNDPGTPGAGASGANAAGAGGQFSASPNHTLFDTTGFFCGTGGLGGGGTGTAGQYATGGSGGGGGGTVRIISLGAMSVSGIDGSGGNGGNEVQEATFFSGGGGGGMGGAIWLQSFKTISSGTLNVNGGNASTGGGSNGPAGASGDSRSDFTASGTFRTDQAAANQTYSVVSLPYDLGTTNAVFTSGTLQTTLNGGSISVQYAGSADGVSFGSYSSDVTTLSHGSYRYVKFKSTITTASTAGATPQLNSVTIQFHETDFKFQGGCGTTTSKKNSGGSDQFGAMLMLFWLGVFFSIKQIARDAH